VFCQKLEVGWLICHSEFSSLAPDQLLGAGFSKSEALKELRRNPAEYDPSFVQSLDAYQPGHHAIDSHQVDVHDLRTGMVLKEDLRTVNGALLASKGQELKSVLVATLRNFIEKGALNGTIRVNAEAGRQFMVASACWLAIPRIS
jgi:hypothetical protein